MEYIYNNETISDMKKITDVDRILKDPKELKMTRTL